MSETPFHRHATHVAEAVSLIDRANKAPLAARYDRRSDAIDIALTRYAPSGDAGAWARSLKVDLQLALETRLKREADDMARDVRLAATERLRQIRALMLAEALAACTDLSNIIADLDAETRAMGEP